MLWHVKGTNLSIAGSVHLADDPPLDLGAIQTALDAAEVVAFECNWHEHQASAQPTAEVPLSSILPAALLADACALYEELGCTGSIQHLPPWAATRKIAAAVLQRDGVRYAGVDALILSRCRNKTIRFLEPPGFGKRAQSGAPLSEQIAELNYCVHNATDARPSLLVQAWRDRDLSACEAMLADSISRGMTHEWKTLSERNKAWIPQLLQMARDHRRSLAVVGCMHMVGDVGLPALFGKIGLNCMRVQ